MKWCSVKVARGRGYVATQEVIDPLGKSLTDADAPLLRQ